MCYSPYAGPPYPLFSPEESLAYGMGPASGFPEASLSYKIRKYDFCSFTHTLLLEFNSGSIASLLLSLGI